MDVLEVAAVLAAAADVPSSEKADADDGAAADAEADAMVLYDAGEPRLLVVLLLVLLLSMD